MKTAVIRYGWEVVGVLDGFEGLIGGLRTQPLSLSDVSGLLPRGGSLLGCTNRGHLRADPEGSHHFNEKALHEVGASVEALGIDGLIVVGGDGSHRIAAELVNRGVPIVGIPKTIDNDLGGTETTFGFDSAVTFATDSIDRLHTTAESHGRVIVVEVMGREAGWIALYAGIAGGADVILIPEIPYDLTRAAAQIAGRTKAGKRFSIVVVAEGASPAGNQGYGTHGGDCAGGGRVAARGPVAGIGARVASELGLLTGKETRAVVLGHVQRGGSPTATDRLLASTFGAAAVQAIAEGHLGHMVAWRCGRVQLVPISEGAAQPHTIPLDHPLLEAARGLGISLADPNEDRRVTFA